MLHQTTMVSVCSILDFVIFQGSLSPISHAGVLSWGVVESHSLYVFKNKIYFRNIYILLDYQIKAEI